MQVDQISPVSENKMPVPVVPVHFSDHKPAGQTPVTLPAESGETSVPDAVRREELKGILSEHGISLKFSQDAVTEALIVEMVDEQTGEAIRQFPSEVSLKLAATFIKLQGHFIDSSK